MSVIRRLLAAGFAAVVALSAVSAAPTAQADPIRVVAVANQDQTHAAADWIAAQWKANPESFNAGVLSDSILALAASETQQGVALQMLDELKARAAGYATGPAPTAKLALVAAVMKVDATDFGGVDLLAALDKGLAADPTAGGYFGPALAILGLARNGVDVPPAVLEAGLAAQGPSGAFGYVETWNDNAFAEDADITGMMIAALLTIPDAPGAAEALEKALAWASSQTIDASYWASYSPANTAGLLGSALEDAGTDVSRTLAWLVGQQLDNGAFAASLDGTTANLMATTQAILLLAETSYATVTFVPAEVSPPVDPDPGQNQTDPSPSPSTTDETKPVKLPSTGDADGLAGLITIVLVATAGGTVFARRR
ncbi:LPXTG cell wall anchor domain-containing protein [Aestuariimicrobium ganziense]|uniref:LPXTG cell wall anchor domain-containing protein n=1 Tax=Aestuariimicrobium ganziense TaxID=2773677 RepID=UPI001941DD69|nr:LPXTG cell wall anchor domain-containing protein [Aestuariimicrobium ganziense]